MSARTIILLVLAAGMAVFLALRSSAPPTPPEPPLPVNDNDNTSGLLWTLEGPCEPPCEEPDIPPEFDIQTEIDTSSGKNRLVLYVTEAHGFYVNTMYLRIWFHEAGEVIDQEDSPHSFQHFVNNYVKAGETLKYCIELTDPEIAAAGGDIGTGDNWSAEVEEWSHVRAKNRDPLLEVEETGRHCG